MNSTTNSKIQQVSSSQLAETRNLSEPILRKIYPKLIKYDTSRKIGNKLISFITKTPTPDHIGYVIKSPLILDCYDYILQMAR